MRVICQIADWVATPYTIYLILKDPAISLSMKLRAVMGLAFVLAYIISPIDIIPDFIPISGWLDDLVVIPLGLALVRKLTPGIDVVEKRERAQASVRRIMLWSTLSLVAAILLGLLYFGLLVYVIVRLVAG